MINTHMPDSPLLTIQQAAAYLNVSVSTLKTWRVHGEGPEACKFYATLRYTVQDLDAFISRMRKNNNTRAAEIRKHETRKRL